MIFILKDVAKKLWRSADQRRVIFAVYSVVLYQNHPLFLYAGVNVPLLRKYSSALVPTTRSICNRVLVLLFPPSFLIAFPQYFMYLAPARVANIL